MTGFPIGNETDPVRRAVIAAMNRLFIGKPQRSNGRLNITQLAIEADVKRWHLTHQHTDLRELFQRQVAKDDSCRSWATRSADELEDLKKEHAELREHCRALEARLAIYASALNLLSLENAVLSGRDADAAKVRVLPQRP